MEEIMVRLAESLPPAVEGFTILDENGDFNIYLNAKLSVEQQRAVYQHELEHIRGQDFLDRTAEVRVLEQNCELRQKQKSPKG